MDGSLFELANALEGVLTVMMMPADVQLSSAAHQRCRGDIMVRVNVTGARTVPS